MHGDYRLDNTMLATDDPGRIVAVLDWEMATLGDPLSDLGLFLVYWGRDQSNLAGADPSMAPGTGFLTREEVAQRYASESGRDVSQLDFYEMLASYKLAIILEGIHALPDGQDRRRGLRPHRNDGRVDRDRRARRGLALEHPGTPRLSPACVPAVSRRARCRAGRRARPSRARAASGTR